jgi:hypothetical protein
MSINQTLVNQVLTYKGSTTPVGNLSTAVRDAVRNAVAKFPLAPDESADVKRLPTTVTSFTSLVTHLEAIQNKIKSRDNKVKTEDWDVAKSGDLKLYKLTVCCIHALSTYLSGTPNYTLTPAGFKDACLTSARANAPEGMSQKATTLWNKTFEVGNPRVAVLMIVIILLCSTESQGNSNTIGATGTTMVATGTTPGRTGTTQTTTGTTQASTSTTQIVGGTTNTTGQTVSSQTTTLKQTPPTQQTQGGSLKSP